MAKVQKINKFQFLKWCDWYPMTERFARKVLQLFQFLKWCDWYQTALLYPKNSYSFNSLNGAIDIGSKYIKNSGNTAFRRGLL